MSTRPRDTTADAERVQRAVFRRMSAADRVAQAFVLSEAAREMARDGIRARHPEYSAEEIELALRRLVLGDDLVRRAWPDRPLVAP
ncbi:MAG TPA: hypothetical protein VL463_31525 [Kofleriaceae bacterium]|nr:hypothetical protein [Kofleriaceae bacterium]